jgi:transposase
MTLLIKYIYSVYLRNIFEKIGKNLFIILKIIYTLLMEIDFQALASDQDKLKIFVLEQREKIISQENQLKEQQKIIDEIRQQYESLQVQLQCLLRNQYGQKSEQGIPGQGLLFADQPFPEENETEKPAEEEITYKRKKPRQGQRHFPAHLPRQRIEYDLTEEQKKCVCGCGAILFKMGEEVFEQLEKIPEQLYVIEHVRFKYAGCKNEPTIVTAEMPRQPIDKCMAGPGLLADVLVKKYDDHLPLYRQSEIYARSGMDLARSTLCDWTSVCASLLRPIILEMKKHLLVAPKIHTDDTPVPVLEPGRGKTKTGRLWIYLGGGKAAPPCAIYDYTETRQQTGPMEFLKGYRGYLQADAYTGYDILYDLTQKDFQIIEVACMAHCRRKFYDVAKTSVKTGSAHEALGFIQKLYKIESEARDLDDEKRYELRQKEALPLLEKFKQWLDQKVNQVLPKSPLGEAIRYTLKNWEALTRYCNEGMLSIGRVENWRAPYYVSSPRSSNRTCATNASGFRTKITLSLSARQPLPEQFYRDPVLRIRTYQGIGDNLSL